jgi:hypothetical protein
MDLIFGKIINIFPEILKEGGIWGFLLLLPFFFTIPVFVWYWLSLKLKNRPCHGGKCYYLIMRIVMREVRSKIETIKNNIASHYAKSLTDYTYDNKIEISSMEIGRKVADIKILIDHSFVKSENFFREIFEQNHIPDLSTMEGEDFLEDRFNQFWGAVWDRYGAGYTSYFIIPYDLRLIENNKFKEVYKREFRELLVLWNNLSKDKKSWK